MERVIGFIGLGTMGRPMVGNLARAGHRVVAYDVRPEALRAVESLAGVEAASHPRETAERCPVVFTCLPDEAAVHAAYRGETGIAAAARKGLITCDLSTVSPEFTVALNRELGSKGTSHMDVPMLGSKPQAESGDVFFIVAGDETTLPAIAPALEVMGRKHIYVGPSGTANKIKLIHNALGAVNYVAVAEALAACSASGVDLRIFYDVVSQGQGNAVSNYFLRKVPTIIAGDYTPRFRLALGYKDVSMARDLLARARVPAPLMEEAWRTLREAVEDGYGEEDASAVTHVIEKRIGKSLSRK